MVRFRNKRINGHKNVDKVHFSNRDTAALSRFWSVRMDRMALLAFRVAEP